MINKKLTTRALGMLLAVCMLSGCGSQNPGSAQAQEAEAVVEASVFSDCFEGLAYCD